MKRILFKNETQTSTTPQTGPRLEDWIAEINSNDADETKNDPDTHAIGYVKKIEIKNKKETQPVSKQWIQLKDPIHFPGLQPNPIYYKEDGKEYFLITPHYANDPNVYKYDLKTDSYTSFIPYAKRFQPNCHGSVYIKDKNELYFYAGYDRHFGILNLTTKEWDIKRDSTITDKEDAALFDVPGIIKVSSVYIPPPINEIHLFGFNSKLNHNATEHLKYDAELQKFVVLQTFDYQIERPKLVYIAKQKKLMLFGGHQNNKIHFCEITDKDQAKYEWKEYELKLPHYNRNIFDVVVVCETIVIVIYFGDEKKSDKNNMKEIWCLDLKHDKWEKSQVRSPKNETKNGGMHLVKASDNWLHAIKFTNPSKHVKIKISDIIPPAFYEAYSDKHEIVISGYCKDFFVPKDVTELILKYYPLFLCLNPWPNPWE